MSPLTAATARSRHPFEIFLMILCIAVGVPIVFGEPSPGSIHSLMPSWYHEAWGWMMALGGVAVLVGIAWRNRRTGVILEQVGVATLGVNTAIYTIAVLFAGSFSPTAVFIAGLAGLFSWACFMQWWYLEQTLRAAGRYQTWIRRRNRGSRQ